MAVKDTVLATVGDSVHVVPGRRWRCSRSRIRSADGCGSGRAGPHTADTSAGEVARDDEKTGGDQEKDSESDHKSHPCKALRARRPRWCSCTGVRVMEETCQEQGPKKKCREGAEEERADGDVGGGGPPFEGQQEPERLGPADHRAAHGKNNGHRGKVRHGDE